MKIAPLDPVILTQADIDAMHEEWLRSAEAAGCLRAPKFVFNPPRLAMKGGERTGPAWKRPAKERKNSFPKA